MEPRGRPPGARVDREILPGGGTVEYGYDGGSERPLWVRDARGTIVLRYEHGQVTSLVAGDEVRTFTRDVEGRVLHATRQGGGQEVSTVERGYDTLGNIAREKTLLGGELVADIVLSHGERGLARLGPFAWTRDRLGRATAVTERGAPIATFVHKGLQGPTSRRLKNGVTSRYEYDDQGRRRASRDTAATAVGGATVTWLPERRQVIETLGGPSATATPRVRITGVHTLDARGRLVAERLTAPAGNVVAGRHYTLDGRGNWLTGLDEATGTSVNPSRDAMDGLSEFRGVIRRDERGFVIGVGDQEAFSWSTLGELQGVDRDGRKIRYAYDPLGRLIGRTVDGNRTDRLAWTLGRIVWHWSADRGGEWLIPGDGRDEHIARIAGGAGSGSWLHQDHAGKTYLVTDSSGKARDLVAYSAFGEPMHIAGAGGPGLEYGLHGHLVDPLT
ncbi:MAG: hypothetical protein L0206_10480, partial [Actinobacteria bacterium]|nr:hypothetical protein [Actinomycetota bacterium]